MSDLKPCYGKCELCVWKYNGGCPSGTDGTAVPERGTSMRLIDADVACKGCIRYRTSLSCEECVVKAAPTVDAVPVVRCRECKHYDTADFDGDILCGCTLHSAMLDITPDSFCSYGERKEGAD